MNPPCAATHRVTFKNTTLPVEVLVYSSEAHPGYWNVKATVHSYERDRGAPIEGFSVTYSHKFPRKQPSKVRLARWVRSGGTGSGTWWATSPRCMSPSY